MTWWMVDFTFSLASPSFLEMQIFVLGFKQHVSKLTVTVDLLLGNIPARSTFLAPDVKAALAPYLQVPSSPSNPNRR